ncbi:MAG: succinylglutamate desuccinylase/aspartoacylase family protein [Pseudomonadota bacterium]|nr:succinylglutamate desuccinylase/aspartoacylase family protein [Pseudomonadota bacterium]
MARLPTIRVRVAADGAPLHVGLLSIGDWEVPCTVGARGLVPASLKREGDKRTPIGVFPLRYGFVDRATFADFPSDLAFPFVPLAPDMIWEEEGPHYNRLVRADGAERPEERLARPREEALFKIAIPIGYNDAVAEAGRGSALFIHAARSDGSGTAGCIGVPSEHIPDLMRRLEPGMVIDIDYVESTPPRPRVDGSLEVVRFVGLKRGPNLIVLGAVHGNETCGPEAISRAVAEIRAGRRVIRRGAVTFIPVVNLKAYYQHSREGDRNLNRDLTDKVLPQDYEDRVGNRLCALLREHDVLLDIHSFKGRGEPFVFAGPADNQGDLEPFSHAAAETAFAARLGPSLVIHGWLEVFRRAHIERRRLNLPGRPVSDGVGTTEYMRYAGGYGVTIECGQHDDPAALDVGLEAIHRALTHLGLVDAPAPPVTVRSAIRMVDVCLCEAEGDRIDEGFGTGDPVAAGQVIARRATGEPIVAPRDGYLIFPNPTAKPGEVLFYFGVPSERDFARS